MIGSVSGNFSQGLGDSGDSWKCDWNVF